MTDRIQQKQPDKSTVALSDWPLSGAANYAAEYWIDAWQRSILFLDVLRQRGNNCAEHNSRKAPNVLSFDVEEHFRIEAAAGLTIAPALKDL